MYTFKGSPVSYTHLDVYKRQVETMCKVAQGVNHGAAPIPEEAKWVQAKEIKDISGLTHGVGWCAPVSYTHLDVYKRQAPLRSG